MLKMWLIVTITTPDCGPEAEALQENVIGRRSVTVAAIIAW
jgi:hypothetical protein